MERINKNNKDLGMTADDLKSQMFRSMKSSGVLQQLKSQLRQSMINELRGKSTRGDLQTSDLLAATIKNKNEHSWMQQAVDNLFLQHIKQCKYQYTLSLFQQESGLNAYDSSLTDKLLSKLGVPDILNLEETSFDQGPPKSSTPRSTEDKSSDILLYKILDGLSTVTQRGDKENISVIKPDEKKNMTLAEKLKAVDDEVIEKHKQFEPSISVTTLSVATKKAEEAAERRAKVALEQWKALELAKMRVEESTAYKDKLDSRLHCLENDYQIRRNALQSRERSAIDRLNGQRESMEKEMHEQRQSLLFELEKIKSKEDTLYKREQLIHEMEAVKLSQKLDIISAPVIGQDIPDSTTDQGRESFVSSIADSFRISTSKKQVITTNALNTVLEEVHEKSMHIQSLKQEISELKKDLAFDRSLRKTNANTENNELRSELNDLKIALENLAESKNRTFTPRSTSNAEKLELKVSQLEAKNREELLQKTHLEDMLKQMKLALEESNNALLYLSNNHPPTKIPQPLQATLERHTNNPSSHRDPVRDYEPLSEDSFQFNPVLAASNYVDVPTDQPTGIRLDIRQRIKDLEIQSDELDEEYKKYVNTNYKQLLEQQAKSRTHNHPRYNENNFSAPKDSYKLLKSHPSTPQPTGRVHISLKQPEVTQDITDPHFSESKDYNYAYKGNGNSVKSDLQQDLTNIHASDKPLHKEIDRISSSSSSEASLENEAALRLGDFSKTSSEEESKSSDSSPRIETVRKVEKEPEIKKSSPLILSSSIGNASTLPPITMNRTLQPLPQTTPAYSLKPQTESDISDESISKKEQVSLNEILNKESESSDKTDSVISYVKSMSDSLKLSNKAESKKEEQGHEIVSISEVHPPSLSSDDSESNPTKEKMFLSSESSESHLSKQNQNFTKSLESNKGHMDPPKQTPVKVDRYSFNARPYYQTDETLTNDVSEGTVDSISENIEEIVEKLDDKSESDISKQESLDLSKPQPKKPPAYNLQSPEGIDAMLKWGEENEPELNYSDDSFNSDKSSSRNDKPKVDKVFASYKDDHSYKGDEEVDIFGGSEHSYSINDENSKQEAKESSSNDSW